MRVHKFLIPPREVNQEVRSKTISKPAFGTKIFARATTLLLLCVPLFISVSAPAADITGVWASDVKACGKAFVGNGARLSLSKDAFVIDGGSIRGRIANCKIKTRKQDGNLVHLIAVCAIDVLLSNTEITLKIIDDNKIARVFAAAPEMEIPYYKCLR